MSLGATPAYFGANLGEAKEGEGVKVDEVIAGSPAATAGLKSGDYMSKLEGADFTRPGRLADILFEKKPGDALTFAVRREGQEMALKAILVADTGGRGRGAGGAGRGGAGGAGGARGGGGGGGGGRGGAGGRGGGPPTTIWKKDVFRLAVIAVEYPDAKHNAKISTHEWEEALFSRGIYGRKSSATGQPVFGSLNDYIHEQSYGGLRLEGKVFEWVEVGKKRGEYVQGSGTSNKTALLVEALAKINERDGKDAFQGFDGYLFIYAGDRVRTNAGAVYYPHAGSIGQQNDNHPYFLNCEGGTRMSQVGTLVKEFGRVLGLPDLAARTESLGSEGLGVWCAMSDPLAVGQPPIPTGRPQHYSAWCKEKMGWLRPAVIDPTVKQKLILAPVEGSPNECVKVLVRPDGSEYLLLENRKKAGFDTDLPGEGLLIWRVTNGRPILEESHGVEGPTGPTVHLSAVPYPSSVNNAFTPDTAPSSRSPQGGGLPIHITEVQRLPDGRIAFQIGYDYH
jgi:M6 family metalloprotease-like protein